MGEPSKQDDAVEALKLDIIISNMDDLKLETRENTQSSLFQQLE